MSSNSREPSSREGRLNEVLAAYLAAVEAGRSPNRDALLRQHPEFSTELRDFFADHDRMRRATAPVRAPLSASDAQPPTGPEAAPPPGVIRVRYFGDYELLEELGRGGMGVVYKARQRSLNRLVAVKMILSAQFATSEEVERFRRETRAVAQLDHPGIVPLYEIGEHDGQRYFSMKWIDGNNLSQDMPHFRGNHRAAAFLLVKVARAVHAAHRHNILHRDLKPGNILLDTTKQPHVTDFGLAKRLDGASSLSPAGAAVGTPGYMAPEQAAARTGGLFPAADIYSLGAILYEMLTGQPPFRAATPLETLLQVIESEPPPPRQLNPKIDRDLEIICLKCLDKRPQRRYTSAEKLAEDLENWVEGKPIQARRVNRAERAWLWCRRKPVLAALSATAALLLVLVAVAVPISVINDGRRKEAERLKKEADWEKEIADGLKKEADHKARVEEDKKRQREYLADMRTASLAWRVSDFAEVRRLLEKYRLATKDETDFRGWEWNLFDAGSRGHLATIRVPRQIYSFSWSPDGQRMAWSTGDN
ncbi:MAG TPA: serine/threonine-protein kinase, partial [Gemmataceae bacterium]